MAKETIALIAVSCVLFVALVIALVLLFKTRAKLNAATGGEKRVSKIKVVDGVRYTKDDAVHKGGELNVTHNEGDITLARGREYTVVKNGELMPGKYTVLTADGDAEVFNIRIGGFVREVAHNTSIVLAEGDKVCAVSHTVILR